MFKLYLGSAPPVISQNRPAQNRTAPPTGRAPALPRQGSKENNRRAPAQPTNNSYLQTPDPGVAGSVLVCFLCFTFCSQ